MRTFRLAINLDTPAFELGNEKQEVARILQGVANDLLSQQWGEGLLTDRDGNYVGDNWIDSKY